MVRGMGGEAEGSGCSYYVVSTTYLTPEALELFRSRGCSVEWPDKGLDAGAWLLERRDRVNIILLGLQLRLTANLIEAMDNLRLVVAMSSGVDHIDLEAAEKRGVCVANQPEAIAEAVAEHAVGMILSSLRRITEGHEYVASGSWFSERRFMRGVSLRGKTVGIVGLGRIGSLVAAEARSLGARRILYWSRRRKRELEQLLKAEPASLERVFRESDIVVAVLPDTPQTRGLIGYSLLSLLKPGALFVNIGRGSTVDADAVARIIEERGDVRVALDVYPEEPLHPDSKLALLAKTTGRVLLTPHHAGGTVESMKATRYLAALQALYYIEHGMVWNPVTSHCREARDIPDLWSFLEKFY